VLHVSLQPHPKNQQTAGVRNLHWKTTVNHQHGTHGLPGDIMILMEKYYIGPLTYGEEKKLSRTVCHKSRIKCFLLAMAADVISNLVSSLLTQVSSIFQFKVKTQNSTIKTSFFQILSPSKIFLETSNIGQARIF